MELAQFSWALVVQIPTQAEGVRRLVVLPLSPIGFATKVEPEHFVVQVQTLRNRGEAFPKIKAALCVHLEVGVQIEVTSRSVYASRCAVLKEVAEDVAPL